MNYLMLQELYKIASITKKYNESIREELCLIKAKTINEKKLYRKVKDLVY